LYRQFSRSGRSPAIRRTIISFRTNSSDSFSIAFSQNFNRQQSACYNGGDAAAPILVYFGIGHPLLLRFATIAALTASCENLFTPTCRTAKNRRLLLPSIGDDQA